MKKLFFFSLLLLSLADLQAQASFSMGLRCDALFTGGSRSVNEKTPSQKKELNPSPALSLRWIFANNNHFDIGAQYFARSIHYKPFYFENQSVRIQHTLLSFPIQLGIALKSSNTFLRHGAAIGLSPAILLKEKGILYVDGVIEAENTPLIFPSPNKFFTDLQVGYFVNYQFAERFSAEIQLKAGSSFNAAIFNQSPVRATYAGACFSVYYLFNEK